MIDRSPLSVLREPAWSTLVRRCAAALARDKELDTTVASLLRPVRMLEAMAGDALGALGEDVLRADRLRVMLHGSWPYATLVTEATALARELDDPKRLTELAMGDREIKPAPAKAKLPDALPYELGVIDPGALVLVAIAAIRVAPAGYGPIFLRTVHGIALSASGAETLGRLDPDIPDVDAMVALLETLQIVEAVGSAMRSPLLRPFASDPVERGRWSCLQQLLGNGRMLHEATAAPPPDHFSPGMWDGAIAYPITRVRPPAARPGSTVVLEGVRAMTGKRKLHAVFASPDRPLLVAEPARAGDEHAVVVPPGARNGWIGLTDAELIDKANRHRESVTTWLTKLADEPCLRGSTIPVHRIPRLGLHDPSRPSMLVSTPPRIGTNHYTDATPQIATVAVTQRGGTKLREGLPLDVAVILEAPVHGTSASLRLGTTVVGPVPVDGARAALTIPGALASDGLSFVASVAVDRTPADSRAAGPFRMDARRELTLVLCLTALAPGDGRKQPLRVARDQARRLLDGLAEQLGWQITDVELPWLDDALAGIDGPLASADDHRVLQLQRELSRRALLTPGLEHATWLALVPGELPVAASTPAAAARSVAVATVAGLASLVAGMATSDVPSTAARRATRLRILGTMRPAVRTSPAAVDLEWVQQEDRAAGPGAAVDIGLTAVALDADGNELAVTPIRVLDAARPIHIEALVPIAANVDVVELRQNRLLLHRLVRTEGRPELRAVALEKIDDFESTLRWRYHHSDGALPRLSLALVQAEVTTPVEVLDPCDPTASVNLARFGRADDLVVLANDGWNAVGKGADRELANDTPVVLRRLDDGRFWADVPAGWQVRWTLDGVFQGTGLTLELPDPATGAVLEIAAEHDGKRLVDARVVGSR
jgi:hypothetical protein